MLLNTTEEVGLETVGSVFRAAPQADAHTTLQAGTLAERVESFEREVILAELKHAGFHMTNAARTLGLERSHLYKKAEQLGIDIRKERREEES